MKRTFTSAPTRLSRAEFIERFGGIYEHSAWVAERLFDRELGPEHDSLDGLANAMANVVNDADREKQWALICAHPDLAGRAAIAGELTESSTSEQSQAGLDQCTEAEFGRFQSLNDSYKARFDMPFIKAVRHSNRHEILQAFEARLPNSRDVEFDNAIQEIHQIAFWRLEAMIDG